MHYFKEGFFQSQALEKLNYVIKHVICRGNSSNFNNSNIYLFALYVLSSCNTIGNMSWKSTEFGYSK